MAIIHTEKKNLSILFLFYVYGLAALTNAKYDIRFDKQSISSTELNT